MGTKTNRKEQLEHIQGQINRIRNSIDDRQSRLAWQTVNKVIRTQRPLRAKLNDASKEERLHKKKDFDNLLGRPSEFTDEPTEKVINCQHQTWTVYGGRT